MASLYPTENRNTIFVHGMVVFSLPIGDDPDAMARVYYPASPREDINPRLAASRYCYEPGIPVHERTVLLMAADMAGTGDGFGLDVSTRGYERINNLMREEYPDIDAADIVRRHFGDRLGIKLFFEVPVSSVPKPPARQRSSNNRKPISTTTALKVFARDDYRCLHCGTREDLTVDHIHPVSKGGTNDFENLQTLCKSCNSRKGARL